jgi:5-formyltetrahydrofolate cyclo-ligase
MTEPALLPRPQLRRMLRKARRALTPSQQRQAARGLYKQLAQQPLFRRAKHISLYLPTDGEIDPRILLRAAQRRGKATYLPVLSAWPRTKMVFQRIRPGENSNPTASVFSNPGTTSPGNAKSGRSIWCCCHWWGLTMSADAWAWAVVFMIEAWRTWHDVKTGASRRYWGWPMNVRRSNDWLKRAGMCRYRER